jgi:glycine cleavage system transcriptional repressor
VTAEPPSHLVLTAVGPDRSGLVNAISAVVHDAGGSLQDSRMAILGGEFALLLLVTGPESAIVALEEALPRVEGELGLKLLAKRTHTEERHDYLPYSLRVTGIDRPGIVRVVSARLARRGVNVASLESRVTFAPLSGTPLFSLEAELQVPSATALAELRREVGALSDDENLDVTLEATR